MIADVDAASAITAAESGAKYGTKLVWFVLVLAIPLYVIQEVAGRVGAVTCKGLGELIRENYSKRIAVLASFPYEFIIAPYCRLPRDLFASETSLGYRDAVQRRSSAWLDTFKASMEELGIPYGRGDCDISEERLRQFQVVIVPTFEWADENLLNKLESFVREGGHVILGPRWPSIDAFGHPLAFGAKSPLPADLQGCRAELRYDGETREIVIEPDREEEVLPGNQRVLKPRGTLPVEDSDLWFDLIGANSFQTAVDPNAKPHGTLRLPPGQDPPFIRRIALGRGMVFLVATAFPSSSELENVSNLYPNWAPWIAPILSSAGISPAWHCTNPSLDLSILSNGHRRTLWVANPNPSSQEGTVTVPGIRHWQWLNLWEGFESPDTEGSFPSLPPSDKAPEQPLFEGDSLQLTLEPWTINVWEVA